MNRSGTKKEARSGKGGLQPVMNNTVLEEKVAYLRGLIQGSNFVKDDREKMIWDSLSEFCSQVTQEVKELRNDQEEMREYMEAIDEDLHLIEEYFDQETEGNGDEVEFESPARFRNEEKTVLELKCPQCKQALYFEEEPDSYQILCPDCGQVVWNHLILNEEALREH